MHHAVGGILKHIATLFALLGILSCATLAQKSALKPKFVTHHVEASPSCKPSADHDCYGNNPIKPPFCIKGGGIYMPSCPEDGGHLMIWYKGEWTRYWSDEAEAKLSKGTRP